MLKRIDLETSLATTMMCFFGSTMRKLDEIMNEHMNHTNSKRMSEHSLKKMNDYSVSGSIGASG
jgi:DNA polymerase II small subunit/DNA polymerase delta subunit B